MQNINKIIIAIGVLIAGSFIVLSADIPGTQLWSRDFADGQLGMYAMNVAGGKAEVVDVDGQKQAKVTLQFTPRTGRHQLQFFADKGGINPKTGNYFLAVYDYRFGTNTGMQMNAEAFPFSAGNVLKSGPAKSIWSQTGKPDAKGWIQRKIIFQVPDDKWDGSLLQFRLLMFQDGMQTDDSSTIFFRQINMRQLTASQVNEVQPGLITSNVVDTTKPPVIDVKEKPEPVVVPITFKVDKPQAVTIVVEDEKGKRVRNIFGGKEFPAGTHTVSWDGLVETKTEIVTVHGQYVYGVPRYALAEPGKYSVRILTHDPVDVLYEFAVNTGGNPPWKTVDGKGGWLHDHTPPTDVVYIPQKKQMLVCSPVGEIGHGMVYLDPANGKKLAGARSYGVGGGWCGAQLLARDAGPKARTEVQAFSATAFAEFVEFWEHSDRGNYKIFSYKRADKKPVSAAGLVVYNDCAVISLPDEGQLLIIDVIKGKVIAIVPMNAPKGLAFLPSGDLLVISEKKLLRFPAFDMTAAATALTADKAQMLVEKGLDDPRFVRVFGDKLLVSDWGNSHQIKLFSLSGKALGTIGKAGAPTTGKYDELHMNRPAGCWLVSPDATGKSVFEGAPVNHPVLWVTEADEHPKRLSVWTLDGKLLRAFYGPPGYGGGGFLDSDDKTRFFYNGMEFRLNWEKGDWKLVNVYSRGEVMLPGGIPETPVVINGRRYLVNSFTPGGVQSGPGFVSIYSYTAKGELRPVSLVGSLNNLRDWAPIKTPAMQELCKGKNIIAWSDLNADGQVQIDECSVSDASGAGNMMTDQNLTIVTGAGLVMKPGKFTDAGIPVYDMAKVIYAVEPKPIGGGMPLLSRDGWLVNVGMPIRGERTGLPSWVYPQSNAGIQSSQAAPAPQYPGHIIGTTHLAGFTVTPKTGDAGELWTVIGNRGNLYMLTTDGIFITELFRDRIAAGQGGGPDPVVGPAEAKRGMSLKEMSLGEECFWPSITQAKDGNIYLVAGHGYSAIFRVTGLDTVKRLPLQTIEMTPAMVDVARNVLVQKQQNEMAEKGRKTFEARISETALKVDGIADDWAKSAWVPIADGLVGAIQISGDRLYAGIRATGVPRLTNYLENVTAVDKLLFKGGGALDLQIGVNSKADPERKTPVEGDLRLLVSRVKGKTKAMLYRQMVPGTTEPETFISPVKRVSIDRIDDVSVDIQLAASPLSPASNTYADHIFYEFSVPLATLGLKPTPGMKIIGDIGVLRGNGIETTARVYWHNKTTTFVSDIPGEVELNPKLWGWIIFKGGDEK
jgi:hypothetical protein